jgi:hypothetical protein
MCDKFPRVTKSIPCIPSIPCKRTIRELLTDMLADIVQIAVSFAKDVAKGRPMPQLLAAKVVVGVEQARRTLLRLWDRVTTTEARRT